METTPRSRSALVRNRGLILALVLAVPLAALMLLAQPIMQDVHYHTFADARTLLRIPNFGNVASNLAFLLVGAAGLRRCVQGRVAGAGRAWSAFFFGIVLVGLGSALYHWNPGNETLAWDRLPMTLAFMALFVALVSEHVDPAIERRALAPAILIGIGSVVWWRYTGDLRLYAWVQFAPLAAIPVMMAIWPARYSHRRYLVYGLLAYGLAKVAELADSAVFALLRQTLSGHALKHLLAAVAALCVYAMLRARKPLIADATVSAARTVTSQTHA